MNWGRSFEARFWCQIFPSEVTAPCRISAIPYGISLKSACTRSLSSKSYAGSFFNLQYINILQVCVFWDPPQHLYFGPRNTT